MIELQRVNEKGERVAAYTHPNYLSQHYHDEITRIHQRNSKWVYTSLSGTALLSYFVARQVPVANHFIQNKVSFGGRFLIIPLAIGFLTSLVPSVVLASSSKSYAENLLKNEAYPVWYNKDNVVNPDRVFFELNDDKHNEPNIYHSGITLSAIQRLIPDAIVGNIEKPHAPVAEHHGHH